MLTSLFGNASIVKVIDFLLENRFWNYTKTDIARHLGLSRTQLYRIWNTLSENNLIKETGKTGVSIFYQTNLKSPIITRLSELSLALADIRAYRP